MPRLTQDAAASYDAPLPKYVRDELRGYLRCVVEVQRSVANRSAQNGTNNHHFIVAKLATAWQRARMKRLTGLVLFAAAVVGCGNGGPTFEGTVQGQTFTAAEVVSGVSTGGITPTTSEGVIVMRNATGICGDLGANRNQQNAQYFVIFLWGPGQDPQQVMSAPTAPGTFDVFEPPNAERSASSATVFFHSEDSQCKNISSLGARGVSGTVTLTSVGADGSFAGTFDVMLDSGEEVRGSFDAAGCPSVASIGGTPTCS